MKINGKKMQALMEAAGATPASLAGVIAGPGLSVKAAESAVRNWVSGRNHPRVKAGQVALMAQALGARPADFCRYVSAARFVRGSDRKARLVAEMIVGMPVDRAMSALQFTNKRAAIPVRKTLMAAMADAEQGEADVGSLVVAESRVDLAGVIKRWQPKDRGRAHPILKRMSHIVVGVEEKR